MATDEAARHELYDQLTTAIGPRPTETLMGYLPPVGWADVATKQDLELLRLEVRGELNALRVDMADRFRQQTLALVAAMVTLSGVVASAAALL